MRAALAALWLAAAAPAVADTGADPAELARVWAAARVMVPGPEGPRPLDVGDLPAHAAAHPDATVVVFAHGCDGIGVIGARVTRFLAAGGHVAVAPDGFARVAKPRSCAPEVPRGGLHRAVLGWRQAEVADAVARLRAMGFARVALMGHSEGGIVAATLPPQSPPLAARVIEGWTCHAGWPEYRGLAAPPEVPVLALVGRHDPWFRAPVLQGDCGAVMDPASAPGAGGAERRSVVFEPPGWLASRHWLSTDAGVQATILAFLARSFDARGVAD